MDDISICSLHPLQSSGLFTSDSVPLEDIPLLWGMASVSSSAEQFLWAVTGDDDGTDTTLSVYTVASRSPFIRRPSLTFQLYLNTIVNCAIVCEQTLLVLALNYVDLLVVDLVSMTVLSRSRLRNSDDGHITSLTVVDPFTRTSLCPPSSKELSPGTVAAVFVGFVDGGLWMVDVARRHKAPLLVDFETQAMVRDEFESDVGPITVVRPLPALEAVAIGFDRGATLLLAIFPATASTTGSWKLVFASEAGDTQFQRPIVDFAFSALPDDSYAYLWIGLQSCADTGEQPLIVLYRMRFQSPAPAAAAAVDAASVNPLVPVRRVAAHLLVESVVKHFSRQLTPSGGTDDDQTGGGGNTNDDENEEEPDPDDIDSDSAEDLDDDDDDADAARRRPQSRKRKRVQPQDQDQDDIGDNEMVLSELIAFGSLPPPSSSSSPSPSSSSSSSSSSSWLSEMTVFVWRRTPSSPVRVDLFYLPWMVLNARRDVATLFRFHDLPVSVPSVSFQTPPLLYTLDDAFCVHGFTVAGESVQTNTAHRVKRLLLLAGSVQSTLSLTDLWQLYQESGETDDAPSPSIVPAPAPAAGGSGSGSGGSVNVDWLLDRLVRDAPDELAALFRQLAGAAAAGPQAARSLPPGPAALLASMGAVLDWLKRCVAAARDLAMDAVAEAVAADGGAGQARLLRQLHEARRRLHSVQSLCAALLPLPPPPPPRPPPDLATDITKSDHVLTRCHVAEWAVQSGLLGQSSVDPVAITTAVDDRRQKRRTPPSPSPHTHHPDPLFNPTTSTTTHPPRHPAAPTAASMAASASASSGAASSGAASAAEGGGVSSVLCLDALALCSSVKAYPPLSADAFLDLACTSVTRGHPSQAPATVMLAYLFADIDRYGGGLHSSPNGQRQQQPPEQSGPIDMNVDDSFATGARNNMNADDSFAFATAASNSGAGRRDATASNGGGGRRGATAGQLFFSAFSESVSRELLTTGYAVHLLDVDPQACVNDAAAAAAAAAQERNPSRPFSLDIESETRSDGHGFGLENGGRRVLHVLVASAAAAVRANQLPLFPPPLAVCILSALVDPSDIRTTSNNNMDTNNVNQSISQPSPLMQSSSQSSHLFVGNEQAVEQRRRLVSQVTATTALGRLAVQAVGGASLCMHCLLIGRNFSAAWALQRAVRRGLNQAAAATAVSHSHSHSHSHSTSSQIPFVLSPLEQVLPVPALRPLEQTAITYFSSLSLSSSASSSSASSSSASSSSASSSSASSSSAVSLPFSCDSMSVAEGNALVDQLLFIYFQYTDRPPRNGSLDDVEARALCLPPRGTPADLPLALLHAGRVSAAIEAARQPSVLAVASSGQHRHADALRQLARLPLFFFSADDESSLASSTVHQPTTTTTAAADYNAGNTGGGGKQSTQQQQHHHHHQQHQQHHHKQQQEKENTASGTTTQTSSSSQYDKLPDSVFLPFTPTTATTTTTTTGRTQAAAFDRNGPSDNGGGSGGLGSLMAPPVSATCSLSFAVPPTPVAQVGPRLSPHLLTQTPPSALRPPPSLVTPGPSARSALAGAGTGAAGTILWSNAGAAGAAAGAAASNSRSFRHSSTAAGDATAAAQEAASAGSWTMTPKSGLAFGLAGSSSRDGWTTTTTTGKKKRVAFAATLEQDPPSQPASPPTSQHRTRSSPLKLRQSAEQRWAADQDQFLLDHHLHHRSTPQHPQQTLASFRVPSPPKFLSAATHAGTADGTAAAAAAAGSSSFIDQYVTDNLDNDLQ